VCPSQRLVLVPGGVIGSEPAADETAIAPPPNASKREPIRPYPWWAVLLWAPLGVVAIGFVAFAANLIGAIGMAVVGALYGLVAMPVIACRWYRIARRDSDAAELSDATSDTVADFRSGAQRLIIVVNVVLLINLAVVAPELPELLGFVQGHPGDAFWSSMWLHGPIASAGGIILIVANASWAYRAEYIAPESDALRSRTGAWWFILLNRVLAWLVWVPYTAIAVCITSRVIWSW
jgi:hypothetical protein